MDVHTYRSLWNNNNDKTRCIRLFSNTSLSLLLSPSPSLPLSFSSPSPFLPLFFLPTSATHLIYLSTCLFLSLFWSHCCCCFFHYPRSIVHCIQLCIGLTHAQLKSINFTCKLCVSDILTVKHEWINKWMNEWMSRYLLITTILQIAKHTLSYGIIWIADLLLFASTTPTMRSPPKPIYHTKTVDVRISFVVFSLCVGICSMRVG